jgi:hypothetical protein
VVGGGATAVTAIARTTGRFNYDPPASSGMPELQSCYFCGELGDALTAVDVVPADLADESTQRTVVVCSTCHRKLDAVLAPLRDLATAGSGETDVDDSATAEGTAPTDADTSAEATAPTDDDDAVDAESPLAPTDSVEESSDDTGSSEITFAEAAGTQDAATDETGDGIGFGERDPERTDGTDDTLLGGVDETDDSALDEAEATADDPDAASDEATESDPAGDDAVDDPGEETDAAGDDTSGDATAETDAAGEPADDPPSDDPPTGYRKIVRLLQNREFPVERASFVDLASNAYELEESDVAASLDRLVDRGALVESGGELQKP